MSAVAYAAANQHPLHKQCNLPKTKQSLIKLVHMYPNRTWFTNVSEQELFRQAHYSHAANSASNPNLVANHLLQLI